MLYDSETRPEWEHGMHMNMNWTCSLVLAQSHLLQTFLSGNFTVITSEIRKYFKWKQYFVSNYLFLQLSVGIEVKVNLPWFTIQQWMIWNVSSLCSKSLFACSADSMTILDKVSLRTFVKARIWPNLQIWSS